MNESVFDPEAIVARLDVLIMDAAPDATRVEKYGGTLYTLSPEKKEGQFCGVFAHSKHVQLVFSKGAALDDAADVLAGSGKHRRHINFADVDHIDVPDLNALLTQAVELA